MRRYVVAIFLALSSCVSVGPASTLASSSFPRDLKVGMTGDDVLALQKALNSDSATAISTEGAGSPGSETTYFGPKTFDAVSRFQEKYAADILYPAGLSVATGYVGSNTRKKLEALGVPTASYAPGIPAAREPSPSATTSPTTPKLAMSTPGIIAMEDAFQAVSSSSLEIFGLSHGKIRPGDELVIVGAGFGDHTLVHFGSSASLDVRATSSEKMSIRIPQTIQPGIYPIWLSRGVLFSKKNFSVTVGAVTDNPPRLVSVSPVRAAHGDAVFITADALDSVGNTIYSSLGIIKNVPSADNRTIVINTDDFPNAPAFFAAQNIQEIPVTFSIETSRGRSINYGYVVIHK